MSKMKLRVKKTASRHPVTREEGVVARIETQGTFGFDEIIEQASMNTTMHMAEVRMALELCMKGVVRALRSGYIADLGPLGKIYPSCSGRWHKSGEGMRLDDIRPSLYYRPAARLAADIKTAKLVWVKADGGEEK